MKTALLHEHHGLRTFAVVLQTGDEAIESLRTFAADQKLSGSHFTALGAFSELVVAYFDWPTKKYRNIPIAEQVEALSLVGDIGRMDDGGVKIHAHVVVGKADATALGGHLVSGRVRPTLEFVVTETPHYLRRRMDPESGLALIDLSA